MSRIFVVRGPLGVGKTTVATGLAGRLGAHYVSIDDVLDAHQLSPSDGGISVENFLRANEIFFPDVLASLSGGKDTVIDGNFYYQEAIDDLLNRTTVPVTVFSLGASVETCLRRDAAREHSYGEDAVRWLHHLVSLVRFGIPVDTERQSPEETIVDIIGRL